VFRKVQGDFAEAAIAQSEHQIRRKMDELMGRAITEIQAGS
jgi:hypothetical protein